MAKAILKCWVGDGSKDDSFEPQYSKRELESLSKLLF